MTQRIAMDVPMLYPCRFAPQYLHSSARSLTASEQHLTGSDTKLTVYHQIGEIYSSNHTCKSSPDTFH